MKSAAGKGRGVSVGAVILHLLPAFVVCGIFAAVGLMHVTSRVMVVGVGYQLSKLELENRDLTRENDRLKLELATLKSPQRLEKVARDQLGMMPPPSGSVIAMGERKKLVVAVPPRSTGISGKVIAQSDNKGGVAQ